MSVAFECQGIELWSLTFGQFEDFRATVADWLQVWQYRWSIFQGADSMKTKAKEELIKLSKEYPFIIPFFFKVQDYRGMWTKADCQLIEAFFCQNPTAFPRKPDRDWETLWKV